MATLAHKFLEQRINITFLVKLMKNSITYKMLPQGWSLSGLESLKVDRKM